MSALVNSAISSWDFATGHVTAGVVDAVSLPAQATAGNLIIVVYQTFNTVRTVASIADAGGTTYALLGTRQQDGSTGTVEIWWGIAPASNGGINVVVTLSGGNADEVGIVVAQFSGNNATQASAVHNGASNSATTTHNSGSVTPPDANSITVAAMNRTNATWTEDGGFTEIAYASNFVYFGYVLNTASTQELNATSDINRDSTMKIGSFQGAAGSSPVLMGQAIF